MKKDKLTYNSNAKIHNFTIDDINKLSINDIKKLKDLFQTKPKTYNRKKNSTNDDNDNIQSNPNNPNNPNVRTNSDHMRGSARNIPPNSKNTPSNPFFRGFTPNPNNGLLVLEDGNNNRDNSRFSAKSNLSIDDVNNAIKTNMNPLIENINKYVPQLNRFISNTDRNIRNLQNNAYSMNQGDDDYSNVNFKDLPKPDINSIYYDGAGYYGISNGDKNFISANDKDEEKENLITGMPNIDEEQQEQEQEQEQDFLSNYFIEDEKENSTSDMYPVNKKRELTEEEKIAAIKAENRQNYFDKYGEYPDPYFEDTDEEPEQKPEPEPELIYLLYIYI